MDLILFGVGAVLMILGIMGSFLPVLPGVPLSWGGLLLLYLAPSVPINYWVLGIAFILAAIIYALQLVIPAMGTKKYGGSKAGMWGATIGLVIGIFVPIPLGIIIGAFAGAFIGEIINKSDSKSALRAAYGSFIGLLASTFMEMVVAVGFLIFFSYKAWEFRELIF
ncbi:DUF456 domain-containing protein [Salegentibacter mishustinae]|uniref:DUF456 domain-containing protein n=1 Tax=Salegentibacter mishustinae TaxID=270918 RepID=A0A0Q9ZI13_9FLAO|nr:DUF456 domain-containing protein [Salegentibacter mishustinae]KRG28465.1 hypothetical protein APR42_06720 [Salegentibacter mishustinae]PNW22400.1 hypothetical protein APB85_14485 [Salegentibacter mishustinae]PZX67634.1 hypothetical protein LY54_00370 [Salegentibacter mishustinae]GGW78421.1 membrane protein [Salegentibacter mishustinae]